ncbi:NAD-dependent epimerase [Gammaproteobacteria bacterium]|nr:NAD-dependent epimerase [Gammaproteobacteria bacterium]
MNSILVTGAAGFIGFHLSRKLIKNGNKVIGVDNLNDYYDVSLKLKRINLLKELSKNNNQIFKFEELDIIDYKPLIKIFEKEKFDYVINLAAQAGVRFSIENPHAYVQSNLVGFTNIIEACRHSEIRHLIYASTSSIYGANTDMPFKEEKEASNPLQFYAATKKANELMAHSYSNLYNLPTSGLRFFTVYGPWGRPDMALFLFTKNIIEGKPINVFNNGEHSRDFTYIDDIAEGIERIIKLPPKRNLKWDSKKANSSSSSSPYRVLNIGNNNPIKLNDFIKEIEKNLNKKAIINYLPLQPGDVPATYADTTLLQNLTGFVPKVSIHEGVKEFVNWYKKYYEIK